MYFTCPVYLTCILLCMTITVFYASRQQSIISWVNSLEVSNPWVLALEVTWGLLSSLEGINYSWGYSRSWSDCVYPKSVFSLAWVHYLLLRNNKILLKNEANLWRVWKAVCLSPITETTHGQISLWRWRHG